MPTGKVSTSFTEVTLAQDEVWQARSGSILITTSATPRPDEGIEIKDGSGISIASGKTVRYRAKSTAGDTILAREALN